MMDEMAAQAWLAQSGWWEGELGERLRGLVDLVLAEADQQNLISRASREEIWARHVVDSAQLLKLKCAASAAGLWLDLGTGAGFPGLVIACLREAPIAMVEVRPLRARFLERCVQQLGLTHARVICDKVERVTLSAPAAVISARAFAPLDRLLASAAHLGDKHTTWVLPKGIHGKKELAIARRDWQAVFHVEHSITSEDSVIVTLTDLERRRAPSSRGQRSTRRKGERSAR